MSQPEQFVADPVRMRAAGAEVREASEQVRAGYRGQRDRLVPAAGRSPGWSAADTARTATDSWGAYVTGLHRSMAGVADAITSAAAGYVDADEAAAGRNRGAAPR